MKQYTEMDDEELLALADQEGGIDRMVTRELAEEGIVRVPAPGESPPHDPPLEGGVVLYTVGGKDLLFVKQADAQLVAGMELMQEGYESVPGMGYTTVLKPFDEQPLVSSVTKYPKESYMRKGEVRAANKAIREEYEKDMRAYSKFADTYTRISDSIRSAVYAARRRRSEVEGMRTTFVEYMALADADRATALRFFDKAFHNHELLDKCGDFLSAGEIARMSDPKEKEASDD